MGLEWEPSGARAPVSARAEVRRVCPLQGRVLRELVEERRGDLLEHELEDGPVTHLAIALSTHTGSSGGEHV